MFLHWCDVGLGHSFSSVTRLAPGQALIQPGDEIMAFVTAFEVYLQDKFLTTEQVSIRRADLFPYINRTLPKSAYLRRLWQRVIDAARAHGVVISDKASVDVLQALVTRYLASKQKNIRMAFGMMPEASATSSTRSMVQAVHAPTPELAELEDACNLPHGFLRALAMSQVAEGRPLSAVLAEAVDKRTMDHVDAIATFRRLNGAEGRKMPEGQYSVAMMDWLPGMEFSELQALPDTFEVTAVPVVTSSTPAETLRFAVGDRVLEIASVRKHVSRHCLWKQQSQFFNKSYVPAAGRARFPCMLTMLSMQSAVGDAVAAVVADEAAMTAAGLLTPAPRAGGRHGADTALPRRGKRLVKQAQLGTATDGAASNSGAPASTDPAPLASGPVSTPTAAGSKRRGATKRLADGPMLGSPSVAVALAALPASTASHRDGDGSVGECQVDSRKAARKSLSHTAAGRCSPDSDVENDDESSGHRIVKARRSNDSEVPIPATTGGTGDALHDVSDGARSKKRVRS